MGSSGLFRWWRGGHPDGIAAGADGDIWFTAPGVAKIGRIAPSGKVSYFSVKTVPGALGQIVAGRDGNLWFGDAGRLSAKIGQITPAGKVTEFETADDPSALTAGPDGDIWFLESNLNRIGRITPAGAITQFRVPSPYEFLSAIATGPDGNLWFTETEQHSPDEGILGTPGIGRITPNGKITDFRLPSNSFPGTMTRGSDGSLWFSDLCPGVAWITPSGQAASLAVPHEITQYPQAITSGPHGDLWYTTPVGGYVVRLATSGAQTTLFHEPFPPNVTGFSPLGGEIAAGPDASMWFTDPSYDRILEIGTGLAASKPTASHASPFRSTHAGPAISLTLTARSSANPITAITIKPPRGLSFTHYTRRLSRGISLKSSTGQRPRQPSSSANH